MASHYPFDQRMNVVSRSEALVEASPSREKGRCGSSSRFCDEEVDVFKAQIYRRGFAACPEDSCRLSFLSLAGILNHKTNCTGFLRRGDYVTCPYCDARFFQYKSLQTHQERSHGVPPVRERSMRADLRTFESQRIIEEKRRNLYYEARNEKLSRSVAERRLLSPSEHSSRYTDVRRECYTDSFDGPIQNSHLNEITPFDSEDPSGFPDRTCSSRNKVMRVQTSDGRWILVQPVEEQVEAELENPSRCTIADRTTEIHRERVSNNFSYSSLSRSSHKVACDSGGSEMHFANDPSYESSSLRENNDIEDENVSEKCSLDKERAALEDYEKMVLKSERLAEKAKLKVKEKAEIFRKKQTLESWKKELQRREAEAKKAIGQAFETLDSLSLLEQKMSAEEPVESTNFDCEPSPPMTNSIGLREDPDHHRISQSYILPDSTRSIGSMSSAVSASSSSINEDNLSDSVSVVAAGKKNSAQHSVTSPPIKFQDSKVMTDRATSTISPTPSDNVLSTDSISPPHKKHKTQLPKRIHKKKKLNLNRSLSLRIAKKKSLERQLRNFLCSIDTSALLSLKKKPEDVADRVEEEENEEAMQNNAYESDFTRPSEEIKRSKTGLKVLKPCKIPSNAEPSNIKSTAKGVKYIIPSKLSHIALEDTNNEAALEESLLDHRIDESRNALITELITPSNTHDVSVEPSPLITCGKKDVKTHKLTNDSILERDKLCDTDSEMKEMDVGKGMCATSSESELEDVNDNQVQSEKSRRCMTKESNNERVKIDEQDLSFSTPKRPRLKCKNPLINENRVLKVSITRLEETLIDPTIFNARNGKGRKKGPFLLQNKNQRVTRTSKKIRCGKCRASFNGHKRFQSHTISAHGSIARPVGQSQEFTPEEIDTSVKEAFKSSKRVCCYKCEKSSFSTRLGLMYHIRKCGKTEEEIDAEKVSCSECDYRGHPNGLKVHAKLHKNPVPTERDNESSEEESETVELSKSGRVRRSAARKATKKVVKAISALSCIGEDEAENDIIDQIDDDDDDFDEYKITDEISIRDKYHKLKSKLYKCKICKKEISTVKSIVSHIIASHSDEVYNDEEDDYEIVDEEDVTKELDFTNCFSRSSGSLNKEVGIRGNTLATCAKHLESELAYQEENYAKKNETFFKNIGFNDYQILEDDERVEPYMPAFTESISFTFKKSIEKDFNSEQVVLKRFEGRVVNGNVPTFYAGGPIWAMDWAPSKKGENFFALSTHLNMDDNSSLCNLDFGKGLIQIWSSGELSSADEEVSSPSFKYGITHDYGKIWCLKWCPSGTDSESHLGILASACSNGNINIHRIKRPDKLNHCFYAHEPEMSLRPFKESFGQCLRLSWYSGREHRVIGSAYANGKVALYDLLTNSFLLKKGSIVHPYKVLHAHTSCINGLDISGESSFPRYLASGSSDRAYSVWDLEDSSVPITSGKKGYISDLNFFRPYSEGHVTISQDDVYLQSHTQTVLSEPGYFKVRTQPLLCQNSAIQSQSLSNWLGVIAVGTTAGEVIIFVSPVGSSVLETDKYTTKRRTLIYRTEIHLKNEEVNSLRYLECKNNSNLGYVDMDLKDFYHNPEEELNSTRSADRLRLEDITRYPLASINRVSFNPNLHSCTWILSGSQVGIGRLHNVKALRHPQLDNIMAGFDSVFNES